MDFKKTTIDIIGMHCASCAVRIERSLKKKSGIKKVSVNFALGKVYLEFDETKVTVADIKENIEKLGYRAKELTTTQNSYSQHHGHGHDTKFEQEDLVAIKRRFFFTLIFSLPIIYMAMGYMAHLPMPAFFVAYAPIIQFFLATATIISSFNIWRVGFKDLVHLTPTMDTLIFLGTAVAYFYSLTVSIAAFFNIELGAHLYYESTALILLFISLGKYLEAITKGKTGAAIKHLIGLQPKEATVIKGKKVYKISVAEVKVGDVVLVKPGEKIPVDGVVIDGYSSVDEKAISGESIPVEKTKGSMLIGATINQHGVLRFKATRVGKDTLISGIIKIVEESLGSKAPIQLLVDKVSFYFVPLVILIAILAFLSWIFLGYTFVFALTVLVAVLIIACPCALGLATPTAVMMGIGIAAKNGILIKSSRAMEIAKKVNVVAFDKTGTLTKGKPIVTKVMNFSKGTIDVLQVAASIEKNSEHPLAGAIIRKAEEKEIKLLEVKNFKAHPGKGISGNINRSKVLFGTEKLMLENNIAVDAVEKDLALLERGGQTAMILAVGGKVSGIVAVADTLKESAKEAVEMLQKMGKEVIVITGDNYRVAKAIAKKIGVTKFLAEVLPSDKAIQINKMKQAGNTVAMIGDGINDAPALAEADLGIALGSGTDVAMETGEIILIRDDLCDVVKAFNLSDYTLKKIRQNIFWAFFYNIVTIPIAAGVLYPFTGRLLNPEIAALAMAFSSVSVVSNALLMSKYNTKVIIRDAKSKI